MKTFNATWSLASLTIVNSLRSKILQIILGITAIALFSNLFFMELFTHNLGKVSIDFGLSAISFVCILYIFFMVIKHLSDDFEQGFIYYIFCRPINANHYVIGKFLGFSIILFVIVLTLTLTIVASIQYVNTYYPAYASPNFSWFIFCVSLFLQYLSLLTIMAITFFWICATSESFVALLLTIATYFISQNMELLRKMILDQIDLTGNTLLIKILLVITWIFPNLSFFDLKTIAAYGIPISLKNLSFICIYGISYICIVIYLSILVFQKKRFV